MSPVRGSQATEATVLAASSGAFTSETTVTILVWGDVAGATGNLAHGIPQMIPEDELPFWTNEWRELIQEGHDALARGESVEFSNFNELASWLLTPDDDD